MLTSDSVNIAVALALGGMLAIAALGSWLVGRGRKKHEARSPRRPSPTWPRSARSCPTRFIRSSIWTAASARAPACARARRSRCIGVVHGQAQAPQPARVHRPLRVHGRRAPSTRSSSSSAPPRRGVELPRLDPHFQTTRAGRVRHRRARRHGPHPKRRPPGQAGRRARREERASRPGRRLRRRRRGRRPRRDERDAPARWRRACRVLLLERDRSAARSCTTRAPRSS